MDRAWADRLEEIDSAISRGDLLINDLRHPPPAPSLLDIRKQIEVSPPLEGRFIVEKLTSGSRPFGYLLAVCYLGAIVLCVMYNTHGGPINGMDLYLAAIVAVPLSIPLCLTVATLLSLTLPWILDTFVRPIDVEAATTREHKKVMMVHDKLMQASRDWKMGQSMEPWEKADGPTFERLVARVLRRQGWKVELVGGANDGGVDLRVRNEELLILVQCKAHSRPISPTALRDLYGALIHNNAGAAILVARSGVSRASAEWIKGKPIYVLTPRELIEHGGIPLKSRDATTEDCA